MPSAATVSTASPEDIQRLQGLEAAWAKTETSLSRIILRLTMASAGFDPALDSTLKEIRELVRKGSGIAAVADRLDELSDSLLHNDEVDTATVPTSVNDSDNDFLFRLLDLLPLPASATSTARALRSKLVAADSQSAQTCLEELAELYAREATVPEIKSSKGMFGRLFGAVSSKPDQDKQGSDAARQQLADVLDKLLLPPELNDKADGLKQQVEDDVELNSAWSAVLDGTVGLVAEMQSKLVEERREIQSFLESVTSGLSVLDGELTGVSDSSGQGFDSSEEFDLCLDQEIQAIASNIDGANDMAQLKEAVSARIDSIHDRMAGHRQRQDVLRKQAENQVHALSGRLSSLEDESSKLKQHMDTIQDRALRDGLTSVPNRLAYDERIVQEFGLWSRFGEPLTLMVWDVDLFKEVNDRLGHSAGDTVLQSIASTLSSCLRETDFVARYGGEEFVVLLAGTTVNDAVAVAEKIRSSIEATGFRSGDHSLTITASCGYSEWHDHDGPEDLFNRADKALYQAKKSGRNRCQSN